MGPWRLRLLLGRGWGSELPDGLVACALGSCWAGAGGGAVMMGVGWGHWLVGVCVYSVCVGCR